jgi:hypothetical protein
VGRAVDDRGRLSESTAKAVNWPPPQKANISPVDRWQLPVRPPQSPAAEPAQLSIERQSTGPAPEIKFGGDNRAPTVGTSATNVPAESIYTSSAHRANPFRAPDPPPMDNPVRVARAMQPIPSMANVPAGLAPSFAAPSNDLRPTSYPAASKPEMKPWPISSDPPTVPGVRTTSYMDVGSDRQQAQSTSSIVPIMTHPSQPLTQPLPPIAPTQSLPPVMPTQPLPPID